MLQKIAQSTSEDVISLPRWLMQVLNLREGDAIKTVVEGQSVRLTSLDHFLTLRGALKDDQDFDQAVTYLQQAWDTWTTLDSA